jgi:ribosomal protein S18 acetylase RimI-like enzyme
VYENEVVSTALKFDKIIAQENSNDFLLGAFDIGNLVGICGNIQEKGTKTAHISEISHVYVSPAFANKGIATNLLKHTIEKVFANKVIEQIILGVVSTNLQAIKLYQNAGFTQYGLLENYYKLDDEYESLLLMILKANYKF